MNTSALKAFAPAVRKQLMEAVSIKLDFALSATTPDYMATYASQVRALRELATADRKGLVERVAYTWFNRLAALRYLDARNWHPFHARVLVAASAEDTLPELFTMARTAAVPEELRRYVDVVRMESILQGRIPSADPQGEAYRMLVLGACRFYHGLLPEVFERLDDETELLLPDDLLTQQSVAQGFRTEITDEDCEQVEVLGWLYQFYISEKKDEVMKRKAAVPAEDIPAVTQLFTPHWIVRYLVENSLGRLWLLNRPESLLKAWMPYYIESAEPETGFLRIAGPQEIRLCDPAAGSGHMLTYAFDLLYVIYEEEGYAPSEIPAMILRHNLTGIEIDARAAQLAALALTLKAREKSPRFFQQQHFVRPNIVELRNIQFGEGELPGYSGALGLGGLFTPPILRLMHQFEEAKNFGSLIQPCVGEADIAFARGSVEARDLGSNLFLNETHKKVLRVLEQSEALTRRYQVAVTNPPYMGSVAFNQTLKAFVKTFDDQGRTDLFALFITRLTQLVPTGAYVAMITMQAWMFLSSYEPLRRVLLSQWKIESLVHLGPRAFDSLGGEVVQVAAFVINTQRSQTAKGIYFRVLEGRSEAEKESALLEAINDQHSPLRSTPTADELLKIPACPLAYWLSTRMIACFADGEPLGNLLTFKQGAATSDNGRFLRYWHEVAHKGIDYSCQGPRDLSLSSHRWFPYNKGGTFRKWYGNNEYVVNWEKDGEEMKNFTATLPQGTWVRLKSREYYCLPCITYSALSGGAFGGRLSDPGFLFDTKGSCIFGNTQQLVKYAGLLNSAPAKAFLDVLCPTLDYSMVGIKQIPVPRDIVVENSAVVTECCRIARADWDSAETSWDFQTSPLLGNPLRANTLEAMWSDWRERTTSAVRTLQALETENNRMFIDAFGLQDELQAEVNEDQITLTHADARRDITSFLSYAVGCIMGRYSLDRPGLILADAGDGIIEFAAKVNRTTDDLTFEPDHDGLVAVLDDEWFADDIVGRTREFLKVTFGEATLRENIRFIEQSLGRDLRSYFLTDFYKDHLQTYRKRPIYWLVQSPRKGFSVLIYLHRYTRDTMNVILNRYLRDFQVKLRSRNDHLAAVQTSASTTVREKTAARKEFDKLTRTLHECQEWERQTILPLAQARIELDLDDGVKVNYLKLGEALAPIPGLAAAED